MVTQITGAGFNGNHAISSSTPNAMVVDSTYTLNIELHATSWTFQKGHKIRVAVNNAQWPMIWPSPFSMTTTLKLDELQSTFLKLPLLSKLTKPMTNTFPQPFKDPELKDYISLTSETLSGFAEIKEITRNERTQTTTVLATNSGSDQYPWGIIHYREEITHQVNDNNPASALVKSTYSITVEKDDQLLNWIGILDFSSDEKHFIYNYTRKLEINNKAIREKKWNKIIPRL